MIDEKELEKNAILKALNILELNKPKLFCGYQCIESDLDKCNKCKNDYESRCIKWEKSKKYWENKLKELV